MVCVNKILEMVPIFGTVFFVYSAIYIRVYENNELIADSAKIKLMLTAYGCRQSPSVSVTILYEIGYIPLYMIKYFLDEGVMVEIMENSISFKDICFQGKFRSYQAQVLENLEKHKMDSKIHIVAAPGSGKTILGLELIRRLGAPALILSPTVLIQHQWGQRFDELFLEKGQTVDDYVSESTDNPKLITSLTYQGMYSAFKGAKESKQLPLCDYIKKLGVKTICLDEAHHLKTNWHHALESVLKTFEGDITIISLTATPPCDSTQVEWSRYIRLCGEIDEEIPVPPLVKDGTLCPHQDFLFLATPVGKNRKKL